MFSLFRLANFLRGQDGRIRDLRAQYVHILRSFDDFCNYGDTLAVKASFVMNAECILYFTDNEANWFHTVFWDCLWCHYVKGCRIPFID